jgi:hypothetical protein
MKYFKAWYSDKDFDCHIKVFNWKKFLIACYVSESTQQYTNEII